MASEKPSIHQQRLHMRNHFLPQVPWAAKSFWSLSPLPLFISCVSLFMFGIGDGLILQSNLGNSPWTIFSEGVARHTPLSIGGASLAVSIIILCLTIPLRIRVGLNTFLNAALIALALDIVSRTVPSSTNSTVQWAMCILGILIGGVASAFYLTANMGAGPRDGLMVAISQRFDVPIAWARTSLEIFACLTGWLMGGNFGLGTLLFALCIGHVLAFVMNHFKKRYPPKIILSSP